MLKDLADAMRKYEVTATVVFNAHGLNEAAARRRAKETFASLNRDVRYEITEVKDVGPTFPSKSSDL